VLFGLAGATKRTSIAAVAIVPIAIFGVIDAAYLTGEKAHRDLYNTNAGKIRSGPRY
jgi:hypothetical protein